MLRLIQHLTLPEDISSQLPPRMIAIRKDNGLTQAVVSERLDITHGSYGHYERGFRRVPLEMIPRIAKALECSEADLLGISEQKAKRGPVSGWEKRVAAIKGLPRDKQKEIQNVVDALLSKAS
jgi:transcriptional regulator with XRE-family HTH domain